MIQSSPKSERDLLSSENGPLRAGRSLEAHTGKRPAATEGRVKGGAAERQRSLEATRAAGTAPSVDSGGGSVTLPPNTTPPGIVEEIEAEIRPVSPVMVDGGLTVWNSSLPELPPRAARMLADIQAHPEGMQLELPFEGAAPGGGRAWADVTWNLSNGRRNVQLHVRGHVYIEWRPDLGEVKCEFKAPGLWMYGPAAMADYYLGCLHRLLFDGECGFMDLHTRKWRITQLPLCADFVGLPVHTEDANAFVGSKTYDARPEYIPAARIVGKTDPVQGVETLYIGKSSSGCQIVMYDKTAELESKATHSNATTYRHVWRANGWKEGDALRRVELRLRDSGLTCRPADGPRQEALYDLRDPSVLADEGLLRKFWRYHTGRKRMVVKGRTRRERMKTDPRWLAVQAVAKVRKLLDWRRAVVIADDAATRRDRLDSRRAVAALAGIESRRHGDDYTETRMSIFRTLVDVMDGVFEGKTPEAMTEDFQRLFLEKQRRQSAELGEAIQIRSDAIDDELERLRTA